MNHERRTMNIPTSLREVRHALKLGFTLLEILVAMAILSVIILMMTTIFNQSSQAWDRGLSKSEKGMEGRSALNLMTSELKNAVASDQYLTGATKFNSSLMSFNTLTKASGATNRIVKYVSYSFSGGKITRSVSTYKEDYSGMENTKTADLLDGVTGFTIAALPGGTYSTNQLPEIVKISIEMEKSSDTAWAEAVSAGPNGLFGDKDDVSSEDQ